MEIPYKKEMFRTFNMGIGMVLVLDKMKYENSIDELSKNNIQHAIIGEVTEKEQRNGQVLISGINV